MGAVWRAEHLTLGTQVAVKLIDPAIASSEEALTRFRREAQAAAELRSAHVVHIMDYGVENGTPYIAMELLVGESLSDRLERVKRLTPGELADIFTQVGRALARAHQMDIVHRDLKPDNIYLVKEGDEEIAKVLDFGIAKKIGLKSTSSGVKTQTGAMLGTPYYMSPEQAKARGNIDHRTDIWSLGIIAYECLTGVRPFDGETLASLLISICTEPLPTPSNVAEVPPGFDAWFARAASRDLQVRFQSVSEAITQLRELCGVGAGRKLLESTTGTEAHTDHDAEPNRFGQTGDPSALTLGLGAKRSNRKAYVVAAVLMVLAGLGFVSARIIRAPAPAASNVTASPDVSRAADLATAAVVPAVSGAALPSAAPSALGTPVPSAVGLATTHESAPIATASPSVVAPGANAVRAKQTPGNAQPNKANPTNPSKSDKGAAQPAKRDYDKSVGF